MKQTYYFFSFNKEHFASLPFDSQDDAFKAGLKIAQDNDFLYCGEPITAVYVLHVSIQSKNKLPWFGVTLSEKTGDYEVWGVEGFSLFKEILRKLRIKVKRKPLMKLKTVPVRFDVK